jgi:hypothetical protein
MYVVCSYIVVYRRSVAVFKASRYFGIFTSNIIAAKHCLPLKLTPSAAATLFETLTLIEFYTFQSK